jgi:hypothetical protein
MSRYALVARGGSQTPVLLDSFEIGFWSVASLEDALERRSAK